MYRKNHEVEDLSLLFRDLFVDAGFELEERINVPYAVDHKHGGNKRQQAIQNNYLTTGYRDLLILRKTDTTGDQT
jgi:hypothetical protein